MRCARVPSNTNTNRLLCMCSSLSATNITSKYVVRISTGSQHQSNGLHATIEERKKKPIDHGSGKQDTFRGDTKIRRNKLGWKLLSSLRRSLEPPTGTGSISAATQPSFPKWQTECVPPLLARP
mmetsp:Transcript_7113/g.20651  ORF Transcript_7113/g.20651 Transcript_7113/m.20651 type:complete len:124 (-) Transcript_7113:329-700(-)